MDVLKEKFCSGFGSFHSANPEKPNPKPYLPLSLLDVIEGLEKPEAVPKDRARWGIFSTLRNDPLSRSHEVQRKQGQFLAAWADLDKLSGMNFFTVLEKVQEILKAYFLSYTSANAKPENPKCRIVVPYSFPIPGRDHVRIQKILNDKLEAAGIIPDRATERAGQLCFLPNSPNGDYAHFVNDGEKPFDPLATWAREIQALKDAEEAEHEAFLKRQAAGREKAQARVLSGENDVLAVFKDSFPIQLCLEKYGYKQVGRKWISPNSDSRKPGVSVSSDGRKWFSHHDSDSGIGRHNGNGTYGDSWDLFKYWEHGNNDAAALKAAGGLFMTKSGETFNEANKQQYAKNKNRADQNGPKMGQKKTENEQTPSSGVDVSARVRQFLVDEFNGGVFKLGDLRRDLNLNDRQYALARQCVKRMVASGEIEKHGHQLGCYRVVDKKKTSIDWDATEAKPSPLILPAGLHDVATIREGDMVAVAAYKNHAKSAFAIQTVKLNLDRFKVHFHITEYAARMKQRLLDFGVDLHHPNFFAYQIEKSDYIPDKIESGPGVLNVIDHLPNLDNFYLVGKTQDEIHRGLDGALCVITHQKKKPEDLDAIGGSFWTITPTLAVTLFMDDEMAYPGRMLIRKGKEPGNGRNNITNLSSRYSLSSGCQYEYDPSGWKF